MGVLLWHTTMSLDGFIAGPDDAMDWIFEYQGRSSTVDEVIRITGALLAGRRSYDVGRREDQHEAASKPYGGRWTGPMFVLTHDPPAASEDPAITFLSGDVPAAAATALAAAEGKNVVVFGANLAQQCIEHGLLDEIVIHLAPVLLGDGVRLFGGAGTQPVSLERTHVKASGQLTDLRFKVVR